MPWHEGGPPPGNPYNYIPDVFRGYRPRPILHPDMKEQAFKIEAFADIAYDEISTKQHEWHLILEDLTITRAQRNTVTGVMARLSVMMQICIELGKMADILDDESHNVTPSATATGLCDLSYNYHP